LAARRQRRAHDHIYGFQTTIPLHGNAAAIGGRIVRRRTNKPVDLIIDSTCESSLMPVAR
jgi:hypothetical protein